MSIAMQILNESDVAELEKSLPKASNQEKYAEELGYIAQLKIGQGARIPLLVGFATFKKRLEFAALLDRQAREDVWSRTLPKEREIVNRAIELFENPDTDPKLRELTITGDAPVAPVAFQEAVIGPDEKVITPAVKEVKPALNQRSLRDLRDSFKRKYLKWYPVEIQTGPTGTVEQEFARFSIVPVEPTKAKSGRKSVKVVQVAPAT